jgi:hypothetical protein
MLRCWAGQKVEVCIDRASLQYHMCTVASSPCSPFEAHVPITWISDSTRESFTPVKTMFFHNQRVVTE